MVDLGEWGGRYWRLRYQLETSFLNFFFGVKNKNDRIQQRHPGLREGITALSENQITRSVKTYLTLHIRNNKICQKSKLTYSCEHTTPSLMVLNIYN